MQVHTSGAAVGPNMLSPAKLLAKAVIEWHEDRATDKPERIAVLLGYHYTRNNLSFNGLKVGSELINWIRKIYQNSKLVARLWLS